MPEYGLVHYNFPGTLAEFLDYASDTGFKCTELMLRDIWAEKDGETFAQAKEKAAVVRDMLASRGMRASAIAPANDFVQPDAEALTRQVERMKQVCELARIVGTDLLRIDGGSPKPSVPNDRALYLQLIVDGLTRLKDYVAGEGFRLALDNHGLITNDASFQVEVLERVDSPHIGANVDTMNYRWAGHDLDTVKQFYRTIAPYVIHTHIKDGTGSRGEYVGRALGEGEIPLNYAVNCFKEAGYQGPWLVEYEGKTDPRVGFATGLKWLQDHV